MKIVTLVLMILLSASAFAKAKTCSQSLEQIQADRHLQMEIPKIQFGTIFVSVDLLCVAGDKIQTKSAVAVCDKYANTEASQCISESAKVLSTPIVYSKEIVKDETSFQTIVSQHALSYQIPVGFAGEAGLYAICTKTLTIPVCQ